MKRHVFTYGSLMFPEVWSLVVAGTHRCVEARLDDHVRHAIHGETYPGMVPAVGSQVAGILHLDVDEADLERLDRFEGEDYRRETVDVVTNEGSTRADAYLYLLHDRLSASAWEPDAFAMERFIATYCRDHLDP